MREQLLLLPSKPHHLSATSTLRAAMAQGAQSLSRNLTRQNSWRGGDEVADRFASKAVNFGIRDSYATAFFASGRGFLTHIFDTLPCQVCAPREKREERCARW